MPVELDEELIKLIGVAPDVPVEVAEQAYAERVSLYRERSQAPQKPVRQRNLAALQALEDLAGKLEDYGKLRRCEKLIAEGEKLLADKKPRHARLRAQEAAKLLDAVPHEELRLRLQDMQVDLDAEAAPPPVPTPPPSPPSPPQGESPPAKAPEARPPEDAVESTLPPPEIIASQAPSPAKESTHTPPPAGPATEATPPPPAPPATIANGPFALFSSLAQQQPSPAPAPAPAPVPVTPTPPPASSGKPEGKERKGGLLGRLFGQKEESPPPRIEKPPPAAARAVEAPQAAPPRPVPVAPPQSPQLPVELAHVPRPPEPPPAEPPTVPRGDEDGTRSDRATLLPAAGRRLHVFAGNSLKFGRSSEADMPLICMFPGNHKATTLANRTISRRHFEMFREGTGVSYVDGWRDTATPSTHGISIDGVRASYGTLSTGSAVVLSVGSGSVAPHIPHWQLSFVPRAAGEDMRAAAPAGLYFRRLDVVEDDILWLWAAVDLRTLKLAEGDLRLDVIAGRLVMQRAMGTPPLPPEGEVAPGVRVAAYGSIHATSLVDALTGG